MRIGLFGGTFDPPHLGHMILAAEARYQLELDRLLFVLTPDPPHKQGREITSLGHRLTLLEACINENPAFEMSRVEIDRPGPHYAVDTLRLLQKEFPDDKLIYLMGGDSMSALAKWHDPQGFVDACYEIGVMHRPEYGFDIDLIEKHLPGVREKARIINAPLLEIASREIRARIAEGRPYRYYLLPQVTQIIKARGLYSRIDPDL
jgi:nicotinate-nucleotide adenylyltransferase